MKTWLKGGISGIVLGYIGYIITYFFFMNKTGYIKDQVSLVNFVFQGVQWTIFVCILFFAIGALIGWIVGKFKSH